MRVLCIILIALCPLAILAQDAWVAEFPDTVGVEERFEVKFTLTNKQGEGFDAPEIEGLVLLSGPNTSSSYMFSNGESSRTLSYTYYYTATSEGSVFIPEALIFVDGKMMKTEAGNIIVKEGYTSRNKRENDFDSFWGFRKFPQAVPDESPEDKKKNKKSKRNKKTYRI